MPTHQIEPSIVLIDGEHYPPVVARAMRALVERGELPLLAFMVGGTEKIGQVDSDLGVPVESAVDAEAGLMRLLDRTGAKRVIDLSDDPVLTYVERCRLASIALSRGAVYVGSDFNFHPPDRGPRAYVPSVAVIGTGKRTGKTAIAAAAARVWKEAGLKPVVVAMGRGGPPDPEVIEDPESIDSDVLASWAEEGRHAASDYIEDALTARVPTVGAWRAGGGMAGAPFFSNFPEALNAARNLDPGLLVLEGSGAAIPPAHWDCGILVVNAEIDPGAVCGYFGLFKLLLSDVVVLTMCEDSVNREQLEAVESCIRRRPLSEPKLTRTVLRPYPLSDVSGKKILLVTTAGEKAGKLLTRHLEKVHGAKVVGVSHSLGNRKALAQDLRSALHAEALLVEVKAAAVDVVARFGKEEEIEVVYMDNRPEFVGGDATPEDLFMEVAQTARERFRG